MPIQRKKSSEIKLYCALLKQFLNARSLDEGKRIHEILASRGYDQEAYYGNLLISLYGMCGLVRDAEAAYAKVYNPSDITHAAMIAAYAQNGHIREAEELFFPIKEKGPKCYLDMLKAYLVNGMFSKASFLFDSMLEKRCEHWKAMVEANARCWHFQRAVDYFERMAYRDLETFQYMMDVYVSCGDLASARHFFNIVPYKGVATWNEMILAYAQRGHVEQALGVFRLMDLEGIEPNQASFVRMFDSCAVASALREGIVVAGLYGGGDVVVLTSVVNMYAKCGSLPHAEELFCRVRQRCNDDAVLWTTMVTAYSQNGDHRGALRVFHRMIQAGGAAPSDVTMITVLSACCHAGELTAAVDYFRAMGREYGVAVTADHYVCVVDYFARCGDLASAEDLLLNMPFEPDPAAWVALLSACRTSSDWLRGALIDWIGDRNAIASGLASIHRFYGPVLRGCGSLALGWRLHAEIARSGRLDRDVFLGNLLVQMYGRCGSVRDAVAAFGEIAAKNSFSWNSLFVAFAHNGDFGATERVFDRMPSRNLVAWNAMLAACRDSSSFLEADLVFVSAPERDVVSWTTILAANAASGELSIAELAFHKMPERNIVSWNSMLTAYAQNGHPEMALSLFQALLLDGVPPNKVSLLIALDACSATPAAARPIEAASDELGLESDTEIGTALVNLHGMKFGSLDKAVRCFERVTSRDTVLWTSMLAVLGRHGRLQEARNLFDGMIPLERDFVAWNAMIGAYAQAGHPREALELFVLMDLEGFQADRVTFVVVLDACGSVGDLQTGSEIHREICCRDSLLSNAVVGTALVDLYAKCGRLDDAVLVFQQMPSRNVVSWNALVSACARNPRHLDAKKVFDGMPQRDIASWNSMLAACFHGGEFRRGIELFVEMDVEGIQHDAISLVSALDACASLPDLVHGKLVVAAAKAELLDDLRVGTAVLNLYGKCGCLQEARSVFERMVAFSRPSAPLWNAMIAALAHSGESKASMELVCSMLLHGIQPDEVTLLASLTACSHAGTKFSQLHPILDDHFGAKLSQEHYTCLVDHLGRSGRMGEAEELLEAMPFKPDQVSLVALLGACGLQGDLSRGQRAFAKLGEFEDHAVTAIGCKELLDNA
ncbi:putative pentatricopeptide repeat-containing protein At1g77010, mitochondrial [Selaginella moellendorffii]|uniref:putative pentatricopeptide repeat-containing protein At1g77010, mitochondrial n=1 Tax=Selaginella moellendorffii TaxID=88036 RepID=UPI000D1CAF12|nr:putative pentatricopeptide repeat-containing protein At1g77010, mitochondrial [Selaginella moellendorffii]|eukprot:XP_024545233.1 putative pentatricopeptide repeat-containing protein At1g77010, mitochondrial [Selaginella moellendorffii]